MELFQLRYFYETAKQQSVSRAAKLLHISQPALSHAIHKLETELNATFFVQRGRTFALTQNGAFLFKEVESLLAQVDTLSQKFAARVAEENLTLHLNILAAWPLLTDAILEYRRIDDKLRVELIEHARSDIADIVVTTQHSSVTHKQTDQKTQSAVFTEKIYLAVPDEPRFRNRTSISLAEIKDENIIMLNKSHALRGIFDDLYAAAGIKPRIVFESDGPEATITMTAAHIGIGFWPQFSWGRIDQKNTRLLEISGAPFSRDIIITLRKNKQDTTHVQLFYDFLIHYFATAQQQAVQPSTANL